MRKQMEILMKKISLYTLLIGCYFITACNGVHHKSCCDILRKEYRPVVHFKFDSSELTMEDKRMLQKLPNEIKKCPDIKLHITGYTDDIGTEEYNLTLGKERAEAVQAYLMGMGIKSNHMKIKSKGEEDPVACN